MSLIEDLKKIASKISARHHYVHGDKGVLEKWYKKLKDLNTDTKLKEVGRVIGLGTIDLSWFLFCLGKFGLKDVKNISNTLLLDNALLDKWEQGKRKLKIPNPRMIATLQLWMVYVLMIMSVIGGAKISKHKNAVKETIKEWFQDEEDKIYDETKNTFVAYQTKLQPITPWLIAELIAAEGVNLNQDSLHCPYKDGNGIWTIGFGNTRLKDGSSVTENTPPITTEEAYELARWHLEDEETFFDLYCYSVADENLTVRNTGEAFGLSSVIYNSGTKFIENPNDRNHKERFALLRKEYAKYGAAIPDSVVAELFRKYPITDKASFGKAWIDSHDPNDMASAIGLYMKDGRGMHWRRWLEAGLFTGDINPQDLLECPIKGMYEFYLYVGGTKDALWINTGNGLKPKKSTYKTFKDWLNNPQKRDPKTGTLTPLACKKVKDFLPDDILQECLTGQCEIGAPVFQKKQKVKEIEEKTYTIGYEDYYLSAMDAYKQGDYKSALTILELLVTDYPDNALLHNDMAVIYNKTGEYDKAIEHVKIVLYQIGDKSQYGSAQYNAGVAYENKGDLNKALQNYKLALTNGNKAARGAIKRVNKKIKKQQSKTIAFNDGVLKIKEKQNVANNPFSDYSNDDYTA